MSFASEMLEAAQIAYKKAMETGEEVRFNNRMFRPHELSGLLAQVKYWQNEVNAEAARAAGNASRSPIRFRL
jgi:hypothetical protein